MLWVPISHGGVSAPVPVPAGVHLRRTLQQGMQTRCSRSIIYVKLCYWKLCDPAWLNFSPLCSRKSGLPQRSGGAYRRTRLEPTKRSSDQADRRLLGHYQESPVPEKLGGVVWPNISNIQVPHPTLLTINPSKHSAKTDAGALKARAAGGPPGQGSTNSLVGAEEEMCKLCYSEIFPGIRWNARLLHTFRFCPIP